MNNYIQSMRKKIGSDTLLTVGCGAIIEDASGYILLQKRSDFGAWGIPGGILEIGETFEETVKREVFEETNLTISEFSLFGIYSGEKGFAQYENGDQVFSVQIVFHSKVYQGEIQLNDESIEMKFFSKAELPEHLNPHQAPFIMDWVHNEEVPIIK